MPATTHYNLDKLVAGAVDWLALFNSNVDKNEAGRTIKKTAGETIAVRDPFYISSSDGKAYKAANTNVCHGVWQSASTTTDTEGFGQVEGIMTYGSWTWTRGNWIYVSASKTLTQTAPSTNTQPIAFALSATEIYIVGSSLRMLDDGSYVIACAGTNRNILLFPSGTGRVEVQGILGHIPSDFAGSPVAPTSALKVFNYNRSVSDDAVITMPSVTTSAYGIVIAGDNEERTMFWLNSTGTVVLLNNSANVVANADTDTNLCIGTAAAQEPLLVKNRLGSVKVINVMLWYD